MKLSRELAARKRLKQILYPDVSDRKIKDLISKIHNQTNFCEDDYASMKVLLGSLLPRGRGRPKSSGAHISRVYLKLDIDAMAKEYGYSKTAMFRSYAEGTSIEAGTVERYYRAGKAYIDAHLYDQNIADLLTHSKKKRWLSRAERRRRHRTIEGRASYGA